MVGLAGDSRSAPPFSLRRGAAHMDGNGKQTESTVMVVDDVHASRYALGAVLRRAGHSVVPVASGGEALTELDLRLRRGTLPDVALVDVGLPDTGTARTTSHSSRCGWAARS